MGETDRQASFSCTSIAIETTLKKCTRDTLAAVVKASLRWWRENLNHFQETYVKPVIEYAFINLDKVKVNSDQSDSVSDRHSRPTGVTRVRQRTSWLRREGGIVGGSFLCLPQIGRSWKPYPPHSVLRSLWVCEMCFLEMPAHSLWDL